MSNGSSGSDGSKESIKLIQDITKQIITLATGTLAISITFISGKDIISSKLLYSSWILLAMSIFFGMLTLSSLVNKLKNNEYDPFAKVTSIPASMQWMCFMAGFVLLMLFTGLNINKTDERKVDVKFKVLNKKINNGLLELKIQQNIKID